MLRRVLNSSHPINQAIEGLHMTPLMMECYAYHENSSGIRNILTCGADPNVTITWQVVPGVYSINIPLHWASIRQSGAGVKLLLDAGADLVKVDNYGINAAHKAACRGNLSTLQVLIEYAKKQGKIENLLLPRDIDGCTPLHDAVWNENPSCVKLILESISPEKILSLETKSGYTPYDLLQLRKKQSHYYNLFSGQQNLINIEKYLIASLGQLESKTSLNSRI